MASREDRLLSVLYYFILPTELVMKCRGCGEDVDEVFTVKVRGRNKNMKNVELAEEEAEIEDGRIRHA